MGKKSRYRKPTDGGRRPPLQPASPSLPQNDISPSLARILRPQAASRWMLPNLAAITPQYIEMTLRGALAGSHVQAWELFDLMEDTWPRLRKNALELKNGVRNMKTVFGPFCEEDEQPTDTALQKMKLVSAAVRGMRPDAAADENAFDGVVFDILDAWFKGISVQEIDWQMLNAGALGSVIAPRATYWVHPACYAFSMDGRLGLRVDQRGALSSGNISATTYQPLPSMVGEFPPNKFLISICKTKSGSALGGALLRPLAWWWCAANFSADWLLNLAQVFGLPFRWANYQPNAPQATIDAICNMLQNMGSAGWAAFPAGTTLELKEAGRSTDQMPQADMLDRADKACDLLVLGQTLTSDTGGMGRGSGSLALGKVHAGVKGEIVASAAKFVVDVLEQQLFPAILELNYGETSECPTITLASEQEEDLTAKAQQILTLKNAGAGEIIGLNWLGKTFGIPKPDDDEKTLADVAAVAAQKMQDSLGGGNADNLDDQDVSARDALHASDGAGHPFRGNQYTGGEGGGKKEIRETRVPVHPELEKKLGLQHGKVFADHAALAKKHPEYFADSHEAKAYVEHVMMHPTHLLPGNMPDHRLIVSRDTENKAVALEVEKRGGKYRVRSAHTLTEDQFQRRVKAAGPDATLGFSRVESRDFGGHRPPLQGATPSRLLDEPRGASPATGETIVAKVLAVNRLSEITAIQDDAEFAAALTDFAKSL